MIFLLIFFIITTIILVIFSYIQYKARVILSKKIINIKNQFLDAIKAMRQADINGIYSGGARAGAFQSSDEVGQTFIKLLKIVYGLKSYIYKQINSNKVQIIDKSKNLKGE